MSLEKTKVLVIGLDGADFKFIHPLIKQGRLPNLAKILKQGAHSELATVVPPVSPSAWTSFSTGKLPSNHGIYSFFINQDNQSIPSTFCNSKNIKGKTIWELLTETGKNSVIIDVPLQYPPTPINGIMISRFLHESLPKAFYPLSLYRHLKQKGFNLEGNILKNKRRDSRQFLKSIEDKVSLVSYLNMMKPWDLFVVVFQETDMVCHGYWQSPRNIEAIYKKLDWAVGRIFELVGQDTVKFIVSDHGFREVKAEININEILFQLGYLPKTMSRKALSFLLKTGKSKKQVKRKGENSQKNINYRYDSLFSKAYYPTELAYGININLLGRNKKGQVRLNEYDKVCQEVIAGMSLIKNPYTEEKLFQRVWQNDSAVKNKSKVFPPDIYFLPYKMKYKISPRLSGQQGGNFFKIFNEPKGFHDLYGIFFALGKDIKSGKTKNTPSILDLAPTILHILGVAIPYDLDGKILIDIFSKGSCFLETPPKFQGSSAIQHKIYKLNEKKQKRIFMQLKKLGYLR